MLHEHMNIVVSLWHADICDDSRTGQLGFGPKPKTLKHNGPLHPNLEVLEIRVLLFQRLKGFQN